MIKHFALLLSFCLLTATPALAGTLTFDNGQSVWQSTECAKPVAPPSVMDANAGTSGGDMNALVAQHNAYVDAAQVYMNCVSGEAERDQVRMDQAVISGAQKDIAAMQADVEASALAVRNHKR